MSASRFAEGGRIDRSRALSFTFDGRRMGGFAGDTLASALLANGVMLMGRSFKYHRPRGLMSGGASEPNALVTVGEGSRREPNLRASMVDLHDGLVAESQNRWPSLGFDLGAVNQVLSPFIGAGFYYKTFMWPAALWEKLYEPVIRRAAGLGRATHERDSARYDKRWAHCDLLVIGAGPAGLMAALVAARAGARVIVCDEAAAPGGRLLADRVVIGDTDGPGFADAALGELSGFPKVRVMPRTTVFGWYDSGVFGAVERLDPGKGGATERVWRIVARRAVLATGAEERPIAFGNNDLPGIMTASLVRGLAHSMAIRPGNRVAVFTTGSSGHETARDLAALGVDVAAIVDSRTHVPEGDRAASQGLQVLSGHVVADARGRGVLTGIETIDRASGRRARIEVDALAVSGGFNPVIHLACHRGDKPVWDGGRGMFLPPAARDGLAAAGSAGGVLDLSGCLASGAKAGRDALESLGFPSAHTDIPTVRDAVGGSPGFATLWHVTEAKGKAFVDHQNDVTVEDLGLAVREGYGHVELAKRYTTNGMATDQGKTSNVVAIGILSEARGLTPDQVGTTTFRPFYTPVLIGALAGPHTGPHYRPVRRSPLHAWAEKRGAVFIEAGPWLRVSHFPALGETGWKDACDRETLAVRKTVGLSDASTLGKIDVSGDAAAAFLDLVYTGIMSTLPVGKARYGLMLREDGLVMDDGTVSRFAQDHFVITTTTAAAGEVMAHLEFCAQALWPEMDVNLVSVTDQWAQITVAGPRARDVVARVVADDVSEANFPFLAARPVTLHSGLEGRLFRISFSGELGFELAVPARHGEAVADALMAAGDPFGIVPYGLEALNVLRIEKGFLTHAEIDGRMTPDDLGLSRMVSGKKADFIGRALLGRDGMQREGRIQMVGLVPLDPAGRILAGGHLLNPGASPSMANDQGHVSSSCWSPHLNSTVALAFLKHGRSRLGETIVVWDALRGLETSARIVDPIFLKEVPANPPPLRSHPPVLATADGRSSVIDGLTTGSEKVTRLGILPDAPIGLLIGPGASHSQLELIAAGGDGVARKVAPGQVLAVGKPGEPFGTFAGRLADGLPKRCRLVDLSDGRVRLCLDGERIADVLASQTGIDMGADMVQEGFSQPTLFGHVPGQLTLLAGGVVEILVFSTYARDLAQALRHTIELAEADWAQVKIPGSG